jgi:hypothetical protein
VIVAKAGEASMPIEFIGMIEYGRELIPLVRAEATRRDRAAA